jgi:hypothetical protein
MAVAGVAAFWSYAHEDNELDSGGIVELAENLRREFALTTGEALALFIDRTAIDWGDEWRRRIDGALTETTFFIPIVTPRYFTRPECRRELLDFSAQARSLGTSELILPIQYAKIKDFSDQNPDEAIALVARMQKVDWSQLRLTGSRSSDYRTAVNSLAVRLADLSNAIAATRLSEELQGAQSGEDNDPGLAELFAKIAEIFPEWEDAVEANDVLQAQLDATMQVYRQRVIKAERSGPPSARFATLQRLATDELPIAEQALKISQTYAAKTIELDPLILAVSRLGKAHPSDKDLFMSLYDFVVKTCDKIARIQANRRKGLAERPSEWAMKRVHISRAMSKLGHVWSLSERANDESNRIVFKWAEELEWLKSASDGNDAQSAT